MFVFLFCFVLFLGNAFDFSCWVYLKPIDYKGIDNNKEKDKANFF